MDEEKIHIGTATYGGFDRPFSLSLADRLQHVYAVGKTGVGKSTLIRNLILQDIESGRGCALLDPHGDLAEGLLDYIPPWRADDVVYFDPADLRRSLGFNLLEERDPELRHLVVTAVISPLRALWRDSWGPRMEYILLNAVLTLLERGNATLLGVTRLLSDEPYREHQVRKLRDPLVRAFWEKEFASYDRRLSAEAIAPIQNKIGQLLAHLPLRNVLGQVRSTIDLRFMMDDRRILIANLAKGRLGEEKTNLLGSLLVSGFQLAAMSRANLPEAEREPFHLYIDEFPNFTTDSFASILSEARKYGLSLFLAHQYVDQMADEVARAVFGNVGTLLAFRVGHRDAAFLEPEFAPYRAETLVDLDRYQALIRPTVDGSPLPPLWLRTDPPGGRRHGKAEALRQRSLEKYTLPRSVIEGRLLRWLSRG